MRNIIYQSNKYVNSETLKIAFLGTPQFALPILEKLAQSKFKPAAVFCAPDKPIGRKQILTPPPVKLTAQKYDIQIFQPENISDLKIQISDLNPDLIISAAYGLILTKEILDLPKFGCLNIHPSLLPEYRGASPIQAAILNGDPETGVTIFKMDEGIDTGPIVTNRVSQIENRKITTPELSDELSKLGAELLLEILPEWLDGKITPRSQNKSLASYTKTIKKQDGLIDWQKSAAEIERQVRAFQPWPGAFARIENQDLKIKNIKIIEADILNTHAGRQPGEIFLAENKELAIQTGKGALIIKKLQLEGGKPINAQDFLRGRRTIIGQILI